MKDWQSFEEEMTKYLQEVLHDYNVIVKHYGDADSTIPDIEITIKKNMKKFYIETKMPAAQTSQFVVELTKSKFVYGKNNKFSSNSYSDEIINILNENFSIYKNVSQSGMIVPVPDEVAFNWVISNMKNKNVEFVMSIDNKNNKRVFTLDQFNEFFNIKTILRRKKSGSSNLPKIYYDDFKKHLDLKFNKYNYTFSTSGSKLFINLPLNLSKNECYLDSDVLENGKRYFLSNKGNGLYEVKLTSGTNNPNIIFELSLKNNTDFDMFTIQCLIEYINKFD